MCSISLMREAPSSFSRNPNRICLPFSSITAWVTVLQVSVSSALRAKTRLPAVFQTPSPGLRIAHVIHHGAIVDRERVITSEVAGLRR